MVSKTNERMGEQVDLGDRTVVPRSPSRPRHIHSWPRRVGVNGPLRVGDSTGRSRGRYSGMSSLRCMRKRWRWSSISKKTGAERMWSVCTHASSCSDGAFRSSEGEPEDEPEEGMPTGDHRAEICGGSTANQRTLLLRRGSRKPARGRELCLHDGNASRSYVPECLRES